MRPFNPTLRMASSVVLFFFTLSIVPVPILAQESEEEEEVKPAEKQESFDCYLEGKTKGNEISTGGSGVGGFAGGILLGLIGTGIAVLVQSKPDVPDDILPEDPDCRAAFETGYQDKGRSKKRTAALTGGILGTMVFVVT